MFRNVLFLPLLFVLFPLALLAQNKAGTVYGTVIDSESDQPLPFINVVLLKASDTSIVKGVSTDQSGRFEITNIPDGNYLLKFTCIGFHTIIKPGIKIEASGRKLNTQTTAMKSAILDLDEVVVTGTKETFNNSIDRKVYNVEGDIMSKSGTASDLLQNIPSVSVDIDGNVSLRGSQNVMIMINGKTSSLMDKSSATVLDELPANSIERIEVITNPSASYKPDGTSGILNIVLKKDVHRGLNSNFTANVANKNRYNANVNFNYNPGAFNIFGNYGYRHDNRTRYGTVDREKMDISGTRTYYHENASSTGQPMVQLASFGADYAFDKSSKLGLTGNLYYEDATRTATTSQTYFDGNHAATLDFDRKRVSPQTEKELEFEVTYERNLGKEDHVLEMNAKISHSPQDESNQYTDIYRYPVADNQYDNDVLYERDDSKEISIKYKNPFSESTSIEAGYLGEFSIYENDLRVNYFDYVAGTLVNDPARTSHFLLDKSINALFGTVNQKIGAFGILAGLRVEQASVKPQLISSDSAFTNEYFSLFPTVHLLYKLNKTTSLQLNYSKRIHRPHDDDLNPFPEYQDPYNLRAGNPSLSPEYIHSLELGCQLQYENFSLIPDVYYRYTYNRFTPMTQQVNDSVLLTTLKNMLSDRSGGVELVFSGSLPNVVSAQMSLNGFYNQIDASNLGYTTKSSAWSWSGTFSCNFTLTKTTMFQINSNYRSLRLTPQGEVSPVYGFNCGLRQDLSGGRVSLVLTASDIFNTMKFKSGLDTQPLKEHSVRQRDGCIVYLGATYHFGKSAKKKDKMEYDDGI